MKRTLFFFFVTSLLVATLACEEALEKGSLSGNVKRNNQNVNGAFVLLLEEGQLLVGEQPLSNGSLTNSSGNYTILLVEPDKYFYVAAVKDEDGDTKYTPGIDPIGYYGTYNEITKQWIPSSVKIGSGEEKKGIDVKNMYIIPIP